MSSRTFLWGLTVLSLLSIPLAGEAGAGLEAHVSGVRNVKGQVGCLLFTSADGFPAEIKKARQAVTASIIDGAAVCKFDAPAGNYAIVAIHDENANNKLDKTFVGRPTEGYGASRGAQGAFGPKYDDARFDYHGGGVAMPITIRY